MRGKARTKAHLRYITHRRGSDGKIITRALFDGYGLTEKRTFYEAIDSAKRGTLFYKIMISPDPSREDTNKDLDLQHITRQTILSLEKRLRLSLRFIAAVHNADHTPLRHIHGIFLLPGRLSSEEFYAIRRIAWMAATHEARLQRRLYERVRENPRYRRLVQYRTQTQSIYARRRGRGRRPLRMQGGCSQCGYGSFTGIPYYFSLCPVCRAPLRQYQRQRLRLEAKV